MDAQTQLQEEEAKLAGKATRLRMQLDAIEVELGEVRTALRVLQRYSISPEVEADPAREVERSAKPGDLVFAALGYGEPAGRTPQEVYEVLKSRGFEIGAGNVRTILWRLAQRSAISAGDGRYWRTDAEAFDIADAARQLPITSFLGTFPNQEIAN